MDFSIIVRPASLALAHVPLGLLLLCAPSAAAIVLLLIEAAMIRRPRSERRERDKALADHRELRHG